MSETTSKKFLRRQLSLYRDLLEGNATWDDINKLRKEYGYTELTVDSLRRNFQLLRMYDEEGFLNENAGENTVIPETRETVTTDFKKNVTTSEKTISILPDKINNSDELLKAHGFNPTQFELVNSRNSRWNGSNSEGKVRFSSRITVKPRTEPNPEALRSDMDKYFESLKKRIFAGEIINLNLGPKQYDPSGDILEVDLTDLHLGLYASEEETGEVYNKKIAKERVENAITDIEERCKGRVFSKVIFAVLGDILHVDNLNNTTTKGTRQDTDGRLYEMFDEALDLLIMCIGRLGCIAPVDVIWISGNHDLMTGYTLGRAVEMAFINEDKVKFYTTFKNRKAMRYGKVLLGWSHGEEKEYILASWLQNEYPKEWGASKYREVHVGHLHHSSGFKSVFEDTGKGIVCRGINSLCGSSGWEYAQGYPKLPKQMQCFVWNPEKGLREQWYVTVS